MAVEKVIWWQHDCKAGRHSSTRVHRSLHVQPDGSFALDKLDGLEPEILDKCVKTQKAAIPSGVDKALPEAVL